MYLKISQGIYACMMFKLLMHEICNTSTCIYDIVYAYICCLNDLSLSWQESPWSYSATVCAMHQTGCCHEQFASTRKVSWHISRRCCWNINSSQILTSHTKQLARSNLRGMKVSSAALTAPSETKPKASAKSKAKARVKKTAPKKSEA